MDSKIRFRFRSLINRPTEEVFDWHLRKRLIERRIPPSESLHLVYTEGPPTCEGTKLSIRCRFLNLFSIRTILQYTKCVKNESIQLDQIEGIFKKLRYSIHLTPQGPHSCELIDEFEVLHRFPFFLQPLIHRHIKKRVQKALSYKHELIDHDIGMIKKYPFEKPYKVLISGSHGLIGKNLEYFLEFMGHDVWHLNREKRDEDKVVVWDPESGACNLQDFEGFDAVIHLAGENIGKGWWTKRKKRRVLRSRAEGTECLAKVIGKLSQPPQVFISASAVGYYGNRGSELLNETSDPGKGLFISEVCKRWEQASRELEDRGIRVAHTRFGVVLSAAGGALKQMLRLFKWGIGGKIGSGHQYISWVAIDDVVGALYHVMMTPDLKGAVNVVSPNPVPNTIFSKKLAKILNRWLGPPFPEFAVRLLMGQKGEELLLTSARVEPQRLNESGYNFHYPKLTQALDHVI